MKKLIVRILLGLVVGLLVLVILAFVFLGSIIKAGVEKVGPMVTKAPVKLDSASVSVFSGRGELKGFVLGNPQGYKTPDAIKVATIAIAIAPGSVFKEKKHIRSIKVEGPELNYETDLKGSNLGRILDNVGTSAEQEEKAPAPERKKGETKLQVDEFVITGAKVHINASLLGSGTLALPEIRLTDMGNGPEGITPAELSKKVLTIVLNETTKAIAANAGNLDGGGKALGTGTVDQLKKGASGIGDLFKKKP
jgi:hypothetical protein